MLEFLREVRNWIIWSWTYLWALWGLPLVFSLYYLRVPLKLGENFAMGKCCSIYCRLIGVGYALFQKLTIGNSYVSQFLDYSKPNQGLYSVRLLS